MYYGTFPQHYNPITSAGISLTITINLCIGLIFLVVLLLFRNLPLFNVNKKKKLLSQVLGKDYRTITVESYDHLISHDNDTLSRNKMLRFFQVHVRFVRKVVKALVYPSHFREDSIQLVKYYGRDLSTYFMFQKFCIYTFAVLSFIALPVLLPIHLTGASKGYYLNPNVSHRSDADEIHEDYNLMLTSINMVLQSPEFTSAHLILAAVFIIIITGMLTFLFAKLPSINQFNFAGCDEDIGIDDKDIIKAGRNQIRSYDIKYQMMLNSNTSNMDNSSRTALLISPYTIVVHGLPRTLNQDHVFMQMIRPLIENPTDVIKVSLVLDLSQRILLQKRLERIDRKLERFKYLMQRSGHHDESELIIATRPKVIVHRILDDGNECKVNVDAIDHFTSKRENIMRQIDSWERIFRSHLTCDMEQSALLKSKNGRYKIMGSGYGFIVFSTREAAKSKNIC